MLFKHITPLVVIVLMASLFSQVSAKHPKASNPGPTCGAPFCARGLRPDMKAGMQAQATQSASWAAPVTTAAPDSRAD